jgi:hypothetical protein
MLKKQSQFPGGQTSVTFFGKKDYEDKSAVRLPENKANSKVPARTRPLNSSKNAHNANGSTCKSLDIRGVPT